MNGPIPSNPFVWYARVAATLCAGIFLVSAAPAQPAAGATGSRYLLIFDTSSAMKDCVPATQSAVERLFFSMMNGQLQPGDTIGVWAFDRKLRAGDFPLQHWLPQSAAMIASAITNFVGRQHYSRSTRFDAVMPDVNHLARSSERLTVLIFCDGEDEIKGTPFDKAINSVFKQNERALEKADQSFIVVLRSQFGQYTGYTMNSSANGVNFPDFPSLPAPPQPVKPVKTNPPPPPSPRPVVEAPPLVIIGTNVGTNLIPLTPPTTTLGKPLPAKVESNPPPAAVSSSSPTNASPPEKVAETHTNTPAPPPPENPSGSSGLSRKGALTIGAVLLAAAVALIIFVLFRTRKAGRGSLISRSMKK
ncbi:MAG: hypothetical protein WBN22_01165 [Verrucomicrobiia bacterium]